MSRKILAMLLALVLVLVPVRAMAAEEQTVDGLRYEIVGDGDEAYAVITGYAGTAIAGKGTELVIPRELDGCPVREIGHDAFSGCIELGSVTIPETVTTIGYRAFQNCAWLETVTIPDTVTSIGHSAFRDCVRLSRVTIPDGVPVFRLRRSDRNHDP